MAPRNGMPAATKPPKMTIMTTRVIGSATYSPREVSRCTCWLISWLSSRLPPKRTVAPGAAVGIWRSACSTLSTAAENGAVDRVEQALRQIPTAAPGATVRFGGNLLLNQEINQQVQRDTSLGEYVALPITLVVMIVIFGGFVAAGIPFLGAIASVAGALLSLLGFSYLVDLDSNVVPVTTVLGLGLSIDYALLIVSRYREERGAGLDPAAAVERTSATAGRT